jgi:hypothetical protein
MKGMPMIITTYLEHERDADDHYDIPESMKGMPMIIMTYLRA